MYGLFFDTMLIDAPFRLTRQGPPDVSRTRSAIFIGIDIGGYADMDISPRCELDVGQTIICHVHGDQRTGCDVYASGWSCSTASQGA